MCVLANFLRLNEGKVYNTSLFVQGGRQLQSYAIRNIFSRKFHKHGEVAISFADYRQVAAYFSRRLNIATADGSNFADSDDDETMNVCHAQFGHSSTVADMHYGMQT